MTALTSAKSTLIKPGIVIKSDIPERLGVNIIYLGESFQKRGLAINY